MACDSEIATNAAKNHDYLVRALRDMATLVRVPRVLSRPLLGGSQFHCTKDLVMPLPGLEDGWIRGDILGDQPVQKTPPALNNTVGGLFTRVSRSKRCWTTAIAEQPHLPRHLTDDELKRVVIVQDSPADRFTVDGLLWYVMIHEMRRTAQISVLLGTQGIQPPFLTC